MITVIIPNYNGEKILRPCLDSILAQVDVELEVIVIDNASTDNSITLLESYPFKLLKNRLNVGFAAAVNQGILVAQNDFVFLLNSDVVLEKDTLKVLFNELTSDEKIFSIQPKMMQYYNQELIDDAGDIYTPFGWAFPLGKGLNEKYYMNRRYTFSVCAGAALYRKSVFDEIGLFDETYFAYMEDVDRGFAARRADYFNVYCPNTKVFHIGSASFGKRMSSLRAKLSGQNNYLTVKKNMPFIIIILNFPLLMIGFLMKYIKFLMQGFGKDFLQGLISGHRIWKQNSRRTKLLKSDFYLLFSTYADTLEFVRWKYWLITEKVRRR